MSKFTWKDMKELHETLMEYPSYKNNNLKIVPGGDGNTILVVRRNVIKIDDENYVSIVNVIDELDSYDELTGFMVGIAFMYYEGVMCDD